MATASWEDKEFQDAMFEFLRNDAFLEKAIEWISDRLPPEQVYKRKVLCDWAKECNVDEVASESDLCEWAEQNGYVKADE